MPLALGSSRRRWLATVLPCTLVLAAAGAADPVASPVPEGATFELLYSDVAFAEGPAAAPDGTIYFSDIPMQETKGRILRFDPASERVTVAVADSSKSNGLYFDPQGRLVAAEGADFGGRRVVRYDDPAAGKAPVVLADRYDGKMFSAPNDLCVDAKGRVWFTDPKYVGDEPRELDHRSVYRIDPDGTLTRVLTQPRIQKPNGIHVSPDGKTLFVADTNNEEVKLPDGNVVPGNMQLVSFPIREDGSLGTKRLLVDFAPDAGVDGMTFDTQGRLYAAVRSKERVGLRVYTQQGKELALIPTPTPPTNCVFGRGDDASTLYITMDDGFGRVRGLDATGYHLSLVSE